MSDDIATWPVYDVPFDVPDWVSIRAGDGIVALWDAEFQNHIDFSVNHLEQSYIDIGVSHLLAKRRALGWGWKENQLRLSAAKAWIFAHRANSELLVEPGVLEPGELCRMDGYSIFMDQDAPPSVVDAAWAIAEILLTKRGL